MMRCLISSILLMSSVVIPLRATGNSEPVIPETLQRAANNLTGGPWVAIIETETIQAGQELPTQREEMTVWYESAGLVRLRLGHLLVEVTPGQLLAFHEWNDDAYYIAINPRKSIAGMISAELPPLWCPWLAIALADGDVGVSPLIGVGGNEPVGWSGGFGVASGASANSGFDATSRDGYRHSASVTSFVGFMSGSAEEVTDYRGIAAPILMSYAIRPKQGGEGRAIYQRRDVMRETFERWETRPTIIRTEADRERARNPRPPTYETSAEAKWPKQDIAGRHIVTRIDALAPPPPVLMVGEQFPAVSLSARSESRRNLRLWRPRDVFRGGRHDGNGPHPTAVVLPIVRASSLDRDWLATVADAIRTARVNMKDEAAPRQQPRIIAGSPVVATENHEGPLDTVDTVQAAWAASYTAHDAGQRFPSKMPGASWLPASLLLDRVAPGADAAIVVVDRSGWITGVIGPEVAGDDLVSAIAEAVRSAAR